MKLYDSSLVEDDGIVSFDCDEAVVERPMMKRTEAKTILEFIRPTLVVNRDDVRRVHKVELHSADGTAVAVSRQHVLAEARVAHLPVDLL